MRYCLNARQPDNLLNEVDEIKFDFRDRKAIPDFAVKFPDKTLILIYRREEEIDWQEILNYKILARENFILCCRFIEDCITAKSLGLRFYHEKPLETLFSLRAIKDLGCEYIFLAPPLIFMMDKVKSYGVAVRLIPNVSYQDGIPREAVAHGGWVRPEDLEAYEDYISVTEFEADSVDKEKTLYRIYRDGSWIGSLNLLIEDLNLDVSVPNPLIPSDMTHMRLNCSQMCESGKHCNICDQILHPPIDLLKNL